MDGAFGGYQKEKYVVTILDVIFRKSKIIKFSPKNVKGLGFVFRSTIHFLLIFVYCTYESKFIHLCMNVQLFQHHLLKRLFSPEIALAPLSKLKWR